MFHERGWNVLEQPEVGDGKPEFIASGPGKKLVIEVKRASEGRKDRIIPLLSRPRWRRPTIPAAFPVIPSPSARRRMGASFVSPGKPPPLSSVETVVAKSLSRLERTLLFLCTLQTREQFSRGSVPMRF